MRLFPALLLAAATSAAAQVPPAGAPPQTPTQGTQGPAQGAAARRPRPYAQVITDRAHTERGGITIHRVDDRYFFEVPDSLMNRDILFVSRSAALPAGMSGGTDFAGSEAARRVVRWSRVNDRVQLNSISFAAFADDTLPIAISVRNNNYPPILGSFPIQAFTRDSNSYVIDVTDFFSGDTPAMTGMSDAERRTYQVRRLDPARSYVASVRAFPINIEV